MSLLNILKCYFGFEPDLKRVVGFSSTVYIEREKADKLDAEVFGIDHYGLFYRSIRGQVGELAEYETKGWMPVRAKNVPIPAMAILVRTEDQITIDRVA